MVDGTSSVLLYPTSLHSYESFRGSKVSRIHSVLLVRCRGGVGCQHHLVYLRLRKANAYLGNAYKEEVSCNHTEDRTVNQEGGGGWGWGGGGGGGGVGMVDILCD